MSDVPAVPQGESILGLYLHTTDPNGKSTTNPQFDYTTLTGPGELPMQKTDPRGGLVDYETPLRRFPPDMHNSGLFLTQQVPGINTLATKHPFTGPKQPASPLTLPNDKSTDGTPHDETEAPDADPDAENDRHDPSEGPPFWD